MRTTTHYIVPYHPISHFITFYHRANTQAIEALSGDIDVYVSTFKPMKSTLAGRTEKTLMKLLVHVPSDRVVGVHMWVGACTCG